MPRPDHRGARGSNAGDDFHELWALRHALTLLQPDTELRELMVEGVADRDDQEAATSWDGVDCTLYLGRPGNDDVTSIVIEQLKYSSANPETSWTVARLTRSSAKTTNNSVIRKLATAWTALRRRYPALAERNAITVRLISNQKASSELTAAFAAASSGVPSSKNAELINQLRTASGLSDNEFTTFVAAFDISALGKDSRLSIETEVIHTIAGWTDDNARQAISDLTRFIGRKMGPDERGRPITKQHVLAHCGVSDVTSIFPCPSRLKRVSHAIPRAATAEIVRKMIEGEQRICLHGQGGAGKTTVVQQLAASLPQGSQVVVFDCYGAGTYMNSSAYRHPPHYAFPQIVNELSAQLRIPYLLLKTPGADYPRLFMKHIIRASAVVQKASADALLVVVVDAADNSIDAAAVAQGEPRSFVRDFLDLELPPANVRFLVTGRTGRLERLQLPTSFEQVQLSGFTIAETRAHITAHWSNVPETWIEDFHQLSNELPRVQAYAIDAAHGDRGRALQYLRPAGKGLADIFRGQIDEAIRKQADPALFGRFCAGLIALPRPIPMSALAATVSLGEQHCLDIVSDLAPGLTITDTLVGFADEDFEAFVRTHAATDLTAAYHTAAQYLFEQRKRDAYSATCVASTLYLAGRSSDVLKLTAAEEAPVIISDPVHKRDVEVKRLQMAVKVSRETGDTVESVVTLIRGARALKAETSIARMLTENTDLSVRYARDVAVRSILRDPSKIEEHGAFLSALAAVDARQGRLIEVRETRRQLNAWFGRRHDEWKAATEKHPERRPQPWRFEPEDLAGILEAIVLTEPATAAIDRVSRWPRGDAFKASRIVAHRLAARGDLGPLRAIVSALPARSPLWFIIGVSLAMTGEPVDTATLDQCLRTIAWGRLVTTDGLSKIWSSSEPVGADYYDSIMLLCEIALHKGVSAARVRPILDILCHESLRRAGHTPISQTTVLDISLRALALRQELDGQPLTYDTYVVQPPEAAGTDQGQSRSSRRDDDKEFITLLAPIYAARAKAFLNRVAPNDVATVMHDATDAMHREQWRIARHHSAGLAFDRAAKTVAQLIAIDGVDLAKLRAVSLRLIASDYFSTKANRVYKLFSLRRDQHDLLLQEIVARGTAIKQLKSSARDRSDSLMALCRTLADISPDDARLLFRDAVEIAEDIDEESVHELALIEPMATKAAGALEPANRRRVAGRIVAVSSEMALRLDSPDHFPWSSIIKALAELDVPVTLAAIAQWDDVEHVQLGTTLPKFIRHALTTGKIDAATAVAFLPLLVTASEKLVLAIIQCARGQAALLEMLAHDELLWFGQARRADVNSAIADAVAAPSAATFAGKLAATAAFLQQKRDAKSDAAPAPVEVADEPAKVDPLAEVDWNAVRFDDPKSLTQVFETQGKQTASGMRSARPLLDALQARVPLAARTGYLRALSHCHPTDVWWDDILTGLIACASEWKDTPAVRAWCKSELPNVIAEQLPNFARYLASGHAILTKALPLVGSNDAIREALLTGIEAHFELLDAPTVYALAGIIGNACTAPQAAHIIERHTAQLLYDIPSDARILPDPSAIPDDVTNAIARFFFANLSDVDIHRRWRAAHAVRRWIVHCGNSALAALIATYPRTVEPQFRETTAPFHWNAARLWLMIAFGRAAVDVPDKFMPHLDWLKSVVTDATYPHLLVRTYAFDAVEVVCAATKTQLGKSERARLAKFVRGAVYPKALPKGQTYRAIHMRNMEGKRFPFDSMDTLPYWYEPAVRIFVDVTGEEFVAEAERWIVDQWGVTGFEHRWDTQPRRQKYGEGYDSMHRHGTLPERERYHTHLEWHAMWCAMGAFLATRSLVLASTDESDTLDGKLESSKLTLPPRWLADLRKAKPLEPDWWFAPDDVKSAWLDDVHLEDALAFVNSAPGSERLIVHAHAEAHSNNHTISKNVSTALVSPDTASDLMRALQSADDEQDYYLPDEGHQQEIEQGKFRLLGWRATSHRDTAFDGEDPLRYGIGAPHAYPGRRIEAVTKLHQSWHGTDLTWDTDAGHAAFTAYCWGDTRGDEPRQHRGYISDVRSFGSLLSADRKLLQRILKSLNLDLIAEVTITKRNFSYEGSSRGKEEDQKSQPHAFILLFRQNGEIETIEGPVGTWQASG